MTLSEYFWVTNNVIRLRTYTTLTARWLIPRLPQANDVVGVLLGDELGGLRDFLERRADAPRVGLTNLGQFHANAFAGEELDAQVFLQHRDLTAHCRLTDPKFVGGGREVLGSGHDLEDLQWV